MIAAEDRRTWADWRAHFHSSGLLRKQSDPARAERATAVSPLASLLLMDVYEFWTEWDPGLEMHVARCDQVPFVWWPDPDSRDGAVLSLAMYLESVIVGFNSDLCLVPGLAARSDAAEQRWHSNERQAREAFRGTLEGNDA